MRAWPYVSRVMRKRIMLAYQLHDLSLLYKIIRQATGVARLEGYIGEVALIAGAINSNPPLCRILWVLS